MLITSGKYDGKDSEEIFLKDPGYVVWYVQNYPDAKLGKAFKSHTAKFNAKPFVNKCQSCGQLATRATAYQNSPDLYFWCDECDPYGQGAVKGKLTEVKTYQSAVNHIDLTANGNKAFKKDIIKQLGQGKGLPGRVTAKARATFFA